MAPESEDAPSLRPHPWWPAMHLTKQQRLRLWLDFRILAGTEADPTWWEFAEILRRGLEGEYYRLTEAFSEELSEAECDEVRDILSMYLRLQRDYRELDRPEGVEEDRLDFPGFDPATETGCLTYVSFIREGLQEFRDLSVDGTPLQSHGPMLSKYRAMLDAFGEGRTTLTVADISEVLAAADGTEDV